MIERLIITAPPTELKGESVLATKRPDMISFGNVNLWKLEKQDLGEHYRWANNDSIRRLVGGTPHPRSFTELEAWFQTVQADPKQEIFSIKSDTAELLGWAQLASLDLLSGNAEVGIVVDQEYWGRGIGHDALVSIIKYAFEDMRLHRLTAHVLAINLPSLKLFEKLGFETEGVKREAYFTSGRFLDVNYLGLLSRDFQCPKPKTKENKGA